MKDYKINYYYIRLQQAISEVSVAKFRREIQYCSRLAQILNNHSPSSKTYWSILERFYNGKNKLEPELKIIASYFNSFFDHM